MNPMAQTIKRTLFGVLGAAVVTSVVAAQTPGTPQTQPPSQTPSSAQDRMGMDDERTITVTGCLQKEADVPGFEPNVAERAGILEDYLLTNARASSSTSTSSAQRSGAASGQSSQSASGQSSQGASGQSSQSASGQSSQSASGESSQSASGSRSQSASAGSASQGMLYKISGLDDEELQQHANQQVEIRGSIDPDEMTGAGASTPSAGADATDRDSDDLPSIDAESIRMVAASCSAN